MKKDSALKRIILEREEKYPVLKICQECKLGCKQHGGLNLTFTCQDSVPSSKKGEKLCGKPIKVNIETVEQGESIAHMPSSKKDWGKPWEN